jgi:hypothetical protein
VRISQRYLILGLTLTAVPVGIVSAPTAIADCVNAGGATVCAQGTVTGGGPQAPTAGPYYPYPCEYDWLCNDGGLSIAIDPPDRPWRPDGGGGGGGIRPR